VEHISQILGTASALPLSAGAPTAAMEPGITPVKAQEAPVAPAPLRKARRSSFIMVNLHHLPRKTNSSLGIVFIQTHCVVCIATASALISSRLLTPEYSVGIVVNHNVHLDVIQGIRSLGFCLQYVNGITFYLLIN
jgi:hypothetical protein